MVARAEASQLYLFAILDFFGVAVAPLEWHVRICIGVDEHVEGAITVEHGQESNRGCDLSKDGLDLSLDLRLCLLFWSSLAGAGTRY